MATGTKGLTVWCKNITQNYGEDVEIKNMTSSWKNGMAFCAILHYYRPDLIDFKNLSKENVATNNELAFRIAENELGIPALLDVEDMVEMKVPDRLSIMTYVSQYYNYFKDKTPGEIITHRIPSKKRPHSEDLNVTPVKKGPQGYLAPSNTKTASLNKSNCFSCGKIVYLMERLSVEGKLFHRVCFACCVCNVQLKSSTYDYDKKEEKFYCDRHFKERSKKRSDPDGKEGTPEKEALSNINEDIIMSSDANASTTIGNGSIPFKRNEQFVRRGIRPQSSPSELQWEKPHIIKSKDEDLESPTKSKSAAKTFLGAIIKRKASNSDEQRDFSNPSYQQHIDLSNFMNELDQRNENMSGGERVVVGSEGNYDNTGTLSGVRVPASYIDNHLKKFHGEVESGDSDAKSVSKGAHKKKLVLKVKKKKKDESKNVVSKKNEVKKPVVPYAVMEYPSVSESKKEYENIDNFVHFQTDTNASKDDNAERSNAQSETNIYANNDVTEETHYAEPSAVPTEQPTDANDDVIYHNISPEEPEEKQNPLLLAARNRLHATKNNNITSTGKTEKQEERRGGEDVESSAGNLLAARNRLLATNNNITPTSEVQKHEDRRGSGTVEPSAGNPYLNIRSNLRKAKSSENILTIETNAVNDENNEINKTFLAARAHLHKSDVSRSDQDLSKVSKPKTTKHGVVIKREETGSLEQTFLNARLALHSTGRLQAEVQKDELDNKDEPERTEVQIDKPDNKDEPERTEVQKDEPNKKENTTVGSNNSPTIPSTDESKIQLSPFKIEKKTSIKLKKIHSPTEEDKNILQTPNEKEVEVVEKIGVDDEEEKILNETSNPFLTPEVSPTIPRKSDSTNPFLSSTEDLLFEDDGESDFDESNPFADDARLERRSTLERKKCDSFKREAETRRSMEKKKELKKMGITDSNPFADDLIDEMSEEEEDHLILQKTPSIHVPEVSSHLPNTKRKLVLKTKHNQKLNRPASTPVGAPVPVPRPKKRMAPKTPPTIKSSEPVREPAVTAATSGKGTLTKRKAPKPPGIPAAFLNDTKTVSTQNESANLDKEKSVNDKDEMALEVNIATETYVIEGQDKPKEESPKEDILKGESPTVAPKQETDTDKDRHVPPTRPSPPNLDRKMSEKRKAPPRPLRPPVQFDERAFMENVALRDKQPKREEMEAELQFLEIRQRELEMDGVVMEKKLRENSEGEPEEAYLMTWFELVNQKNLLLRRENELIYMCQELDFLQNQRRAEFELRQLMNKPEQEKTMEDRMREDELLADILNFVAKRSNIVDKMDEDRLREYEEDQEISNMMEAQGLSPAHRKTSQDVQKTPANNKKKKEKEKKKEKGKKKKK